MDLLEGPPRTIASGPLVKNGGPGAAGTPKVDVRPRQPGSATDRAGGSPWSAAEEQAQHHGQDHGKKERRSQRDEHAGVSLSEAEISGKLREHAAAHQQEQDPEPPEHDADDDEELADLVHGSECSAAGGDYNR